MSHVLEREGQEVVGRGEDQVAEVNGLGLSWFRFTRHKRQQMPPCLARSTDAHDRVHHFTGGAHTCTASILTRFAEGRTSSPRLPRESAYGCGLQRKPKRGCSLCKPVPSRWKERVEASGKDGARAKQDAGVQGELHLQPRRRGKQATLWSRAG